MLKKILIVLGVMLLIFIGFVAYTLLTTKKHSPQDIAEITHADLTVKVVYCQPYKKGRVIFGDESTGALIPNGNYWRLGANEATEITFNNDVNFAGKPVSAGSYRMYAVPNAGSWEVTLNSELGVWGAYEPDTSLDVVKIEVPVQSMDAETEQLTITFAPSAEGANMNIKWDKTQVSVPITQ
jgi:hypothetical protein